MESKKKQELINTIVIIGLVASVVYILYTLKIGVFNSKQSFSNYINSFGVFSIIVFIVIQVISIVFPVLPTSLGCVVGVILFGPLEGFIYNYIAICLGSILAFALARIYGSSLVKKLIPSVLYEKYIDKTKNKKAFEKAFALAIFFPGAPDDILCYIAGLSSIETSKYILIILVGKPVSIALYSVGMATVINHFL